MRGNQNEKEERKRVVKRGTKWEREKYAEWKRWYDEKMKIQSVNKNKDDIYIKNPLKTNKTKLRRLKWNQKHCFKIEMKAHTIKTKL